MQVGGSVWQQADRWHVVVTVLTVRLPQSRSVPSLWTHLLNPALVAEVSLPRSEQSLPGSPGHGLTDGQSGTKLHVPALHLALQQSVSVVHA